ncbi:metallo Beta lactamase superfamily protein [Oceanicola granulosus HTCC2516]|uniref:Metallo Beta lactamase superfamily protein n=1 Tax=Oceanicola granulosus (strain ATCC BAA-861 / DSM 15982 / KCTC 12143 / HTCC2516) TaxID=314256 RepID=Q2CFB5_OCEGH|nr:metal-dependent hydrolase [Oceanicola granulosus]EAR51380.1 metallo Beta lactamase superfamily protein [Oceanicola granulosus HTCC2516]
MNITWLGHASFRIEIGDQVLLVDPWLVGNPAFPDASRAEALAGATHILLTHGHGDHASEVVDIAQETGAPVCCCFELAELWLGPEGVAAKGFGKGGTLQLGDVAVSMVHARHSSSLDFLDDPPAAGSECGFVIRGEGRSIYVSGDTDVMSDMALIAERYAPDIGILCAGGHFTMDMAGAAFAARKFFDFKLVIPCHFQTFSLLEQSAEPLVKALSDVRVEVPEVMRPIQP